MPPAPVSVSLPGATITQALALEPALRKHTTGFQFERIAGSGHYLAEEQPAAVAGHLVKFFG